MSAQIVLKKPFWKSTTLWINVLGVLAIALDVVAKTVVDPDAIAILLALANIINRFRVSNTVQPLKFSLK